jgi:hypothetical protein
MADKERVRLLVDALRSGDYRQGRGFLKQTVDGAVLHCCLGVACEIAMANGVVLTIDAVEGGNGTPLTRFDGEVAVLPGAVSDWYGFQAMPRVQLNASGRTVEATVLNDGLGGHAPRDFDTLADLFAGTYLDETLGDSDGES